MEENYLHLLFLEEKSNGGIALEWTGNTEYPMSSIYAVQEKAWMDIKQFFSNGFRRFGNRFVKIKVQHIY